MLNRRHGPLALVLVLYALLALVEWKMVLARTDGRYIYSLDDTYIHMAISRNLVEHQTWGVTRHAFTSASSSPLWTLLLSATFALFGVHEEAPLVLNLLLGALVLVASAAFLERHVRRPGIVLGVLLGVLFAGPLVPIALSGMEHILHALLTVLFVAAASEALARPEASRRSLPLLAVLLTGARFEGLFLVLATCLLLALRRQAGRAVLVGAAGLLPVVAFGLYSVAQGWYFVPNSVLLKGNVPGHGLQAIVHLLRPLRTLQNYTDMLTITAVTAIALWRVPRTGAAAFACWLFLLACLQHLEFAALGVFYRYETYLVILGLTVLGAAFAEPALAAFREARGAARAAAWIGVFLLLTPFATRGYNAYRLVPVASQAIWQQQYQMGLFLHRYYDGASVALNDIGATDYLADLRLLDTWGLASMDVARLKRAHALDKTALARLAREHWVRIAMVYPDGFDPLGAGPAQDWEHVADWTVPGGVALGGLTVGIYAVAPSEAPALRAHLAEFEAVLPKEVTTRPYP